MVIENDTLWSGTRDDLSWKSQVFPSPCIVWPCWRGSPWYRHRGQKKTEWCGYRWSKEF